MKLHFSNDAITNSRYRKVKAVINALKVNLEEVQHDSHSNLSHISPFNTLPLLQTQQGTFFSSNTIIRYLASSAGKLYGSNLYQKGLVDQWLDITTCDFQSAVAAVAIAKEGRQVDGAKIVADITKFVQFVEKHLNGKKALVGDSYTIADYSLAAGISVILNSLGDEDRKAYPNLVSWYFSLVTTDAILGAKDFPKDSSKPFKCKKDKKEKKEEEKATKKADDDDVDLFGDDDKPSAPVQAKPKAKAEPIKKKEKPPAKSIVVFDVKVYEQEYDLDGLWQKIKKEVVLEGLVWSPNPKKIPVVGKVFKLQVGCVVEDDKVATDDIFDKITSWQDDVQSIDIVSFQKL